MTLRLMRIFRSVAEHTSFSRASEELNITRPAVSQAITQLEEHLQVRLFSRTTRRVDLTPEGDLYYRHVIDILERMTLMKDQLKIPFNGPAGRIRIEVCPSIAKNFLVPYILEFQEMYPHIDILLDASTSIVNFSESEVDFALQLGGSTQQDVISHEIGKINYVCCASPDYIRRNGMPKSLDDLSAHKAVNCFSDNTGRTLPWPFLDNGVVRSISMNHDIAVNDDEICLTYATAGKGIAMLAQFLAQEQIKKGALIPILEDHPIVSKPLNLLYTPSKTNNKKLQLFIDWMTKMELHTENQRTDYMSLRE